MHSNSQLSYIDPKYKKEKKKFQTLLPVHQYNMEEKIILLPSDMTLRKECLSEKVLVHLFSILYKEKNYE